MKIYKDHIVEEVEQVKAEEEIIPAADKDVDELAKSSIINELIRGKWEEVDKLTAIIGTQEDEAFKDILNLFLHDTYIHIGQLEKFLEGSAPEVKQIEDGKDDIASEEDINSSEEIKEESVDNSTELPPDDISTTETVEDVLNDDKANKLNELKELIADYQSVLYSGTVSVSEQNKLKNLITEKEAELSKLVNELYIKH